MGLYGRFSTQWILSCLCAVFILHHEHSLYAQDGSNPPEDPSQFHLFVLAGQSNMAGRGLPEEQDVTPHPHVLALNKLGQWAPATDPLHWDKPDIVGVGPGKTFAIDYANDHPDVTVGLIPCAAGGSPIGSWAPAGYHAQTKSHPYDDTIKRVQAVVDSGTLKGILWHQGESDSQEVLSETYEKSLRELIDRLRDALDSPKLPFVVGQMGNFPQAPWDQYRRSVDAAHKRIVESANHVALANSRGLTPKDDNVHFDTVSSRALGHRYYNAFQRIAENRRPKIRSVKRIWSEARHNAFTDLIRFQDQWFCVFREGSAHVSSDGAIRVIKSRDGDSWQSAALVQSRDSDLRDAKITITPTGELMLSGAGAMHDSSIYKHQSFSWFSNDGVDWSDAIPVADKDFWLWRSTWHNDIAYGIGYPTNNVTDRTTRLYSSTDGKDFETLVARSFGAGYANESSMAFSNNDVCYCLLRRDPSGKNTATAQLGTSVPPYTKWQWNDLGVRVGGPHMVLLPDGRLVAVVRLYDGKPRTSLCWVDPEQNSIREFLGLPSGGDTSYAGIVWHDDQLWISYYSAHESAGNDFKTAIYLARVDLP